MTKKPDKPKKQKTPKPIRVLDERDQVWSSIDSLTVGLSAQERADKLIKFVESLTQPKKD